MTPCLRILPVLFHSYWRSRYRVVQVVLTVRLARADLQFPCRPWILCSRAAPTSPSLLERRLARPVPSHQSHPSRREHYLRCFAAAGRLSGYCWGSETWDSRPNRSWHSHKTPRWHRCRRRPGNHMETGACQTGRRRRLDSVSISSTACCLAPTEPVDCTCRRLETWLTRWKFQCDHLYGCGSTGQITC